jgi:hypothetical protein
MKAMEGRPDWRIGWIAAAVAVAAALILVVDIVAEQSARTDPQIQTQEAAKRAGAFVTPTYPDRYP